MTDGASVVGPVNIGVLMRAIAIGHVDDSSLVWRHPWAEWRPMGSVREVSALRRAQSANAPSWTPSGSWAPPSPAAWQLAKAAARIATASDERELVTLTMQAAMDHVRASVALAHRPLGAFGALETRAAVGPGLCDSLGAEIGPRDPAIMAARTGAKVLDVADGSRAAGAAFDRLGVACGLRGVALVPIYCGTGLVAVLELGKRGQPFRKSDTDWLHAVARKASARLSRKRRCQTSTPAP